MSIQQIDDIFDRVAFDDLDRALHAALYKSVKELCIEMDSNAPDSTEKTLALRAMHLGLMHYGTALSKQEKYKK